MAAASELCFGPFRLDPPNARLTRGRQAVALKPKAFDVLAYLVRAADRQVSVAAGQCFEHFGSGEAYFPVLEALGRLGRGLASERLVRVLCAHAPTWLPHLPGLRPKGSTESAPVAPPERMLREMAE